MRKCAQRRLSWLLILTLCISLMSSLFPAASAAPGDVYNWGVRGELATELSDAAAAFYTGNNTYASLSQLSGASDWESDTAVPGSALYIALHDLMESRHSDPTDYGELRYQYIYTDVEQGSASNPDNPISSFYTGTAIGPAWDGSSWNREHVWPQSKALTDKNAYEDELCNTDMMMIRPTASSENSSHGNKAYGESTGYYLPKNSTYDLRGDVARILLYGYVRWIDGEEGAEHGTHQTRMWSTDSYDTGVIESKDILLKWIQEDPVDTWELGRNDAVESITGTRNVFVDYPEFAYLLFNEQIPEDLITPSNNTVGGNFTLSFMENGQVGSTVSTFESAVITLPSTQNAIADGYVFVGWVTEEVSKTSSKPVAIYQPGDAFTVPADCKKLYALYTSYEGTASLTNALSDGDTVVIVNSTNALSHQVVSTWYKGAVTVGIANDTLVDPHPDILWHVAASGDGYTLSNASGQKLSMNDTNNSIPYDEVNAVWNAEAAETAAHVYLVNSVTGKRICWSGNYGNFSAYATSNSSYSEESAALQIFKVSGSAYYSTATPKAVTYTVSFSVPRGYGLTAPAAQECSNLGITLPALDSPEGYTFVGWTAITVNNASAAPTMYKAGETYIATAPVTLNALFTTGDYAWELVTDASQLQAGTKVVIAASKYDVALSTNQKSTNRGQADITKDGSTISWTGSEVQELTLETGLLSSTWALSTGSGYLAANGTGSNNHLKTTASLDNFGSFTIAVDSDGISTIQGQGGNERNWLRYNSTSSLFSCYGSGQKDVSLYRMTGSRFWTTELPIPVKTITFCVPTGLPAVAPVQTVDFKTTLPSAAAPKNYTFLGWVTEELDYVEAKPLEILPAGKEIESDQDLTLYALYSKTETVTGGADVWTLVTDDTSLQSGDQLVIASNAHGQTAGDISGQVMSNVKTTFSADKNTIPSLPEGTVILTLGGTSGAWTLSSNGNLLGATANKKLAWDSGATTWSISISGGDATINNGTASYGGFRYNVSSPRFTTYTSAVSSTMLLPQLYRLQSGDSIVTTYTTVILCEHEGGSATCQNLAVCDLCGMEYGDLADHIYTAENITDQNLKEAATCQDYAVYYHSCEFCGGLPENLNKADSFVYEAGGKADHNYIYNHDGADHWKACKDCNAPDPSSAVESHAFAWGYNETQHWSQCEICEYESQIALHSGGKATCTEQAQCKECDQYYGEAKGHDFEDSEDFRAVAGGHQAKCTRCDVYDETVLPHSGGKATCTKQAICSDCDTAYGDTAPHDYTEEKNDDTHHWYQCEDCDATTTPEVHTGGTATCTRRAECDVCGEKYGDTAPHSYTIWDHDSTYHWQECECGASDESTKVPHNEETMTVQYDEDRHWYVCVCGNETSKQRHDGGEASCTKQALCETCQQPYGDLADHDYTVTMQDGETHWKKCSACSAIDEDSIEKHSGGTATCSQLAVCTDCGIGYGEYTAHDFSVASTEEKYLQTQATCQSRAVYYYSCAACGAKGTQTFASGDYAAHSYTVAQHNETHHWTKCATCTEIIDKAEHYGGTATCAAPAVCAGCQTPYGDTLAHTPAAADVYGVNDTHHYQECACGEWLNKEKHSFSQWTTVTEATPDTKGSKERSCIVCGYAQTEEIPATGTGKHGDMNQFVLPAILLVLSVCGITAIAVVISVKKRKAIG